MLLDIAKESFFDKNIFRKDRSGLNYEITFCACAHTTMSDEELFDDVAEDDDLDEDDDLVDFSDDDDDDLDTSFDDREEEDGY